MLTVHEKHGARLIGRWQGDDGRMVVIWEYDSRADLERIQKAVREDPESSATAALRRSL